MQRRLSAIPISNCLHSHHAILSACHLRTFRNSTETLPSQTRDKNRRSSSPGLPLHQQFAMSSSLRSSTPFVVRFYELPKDGHLTRDTEGRSLDDVLQFDDKALEYNHDYIQVLFPLPERSFVNPDAPIITQAARDTFVERADLRERLALAFNRMASFYGFDVSKTDNGPVISPRQNFMTLARRNWLTRFDHNHLRITRIIRCLRILGLESLSAAFHQALKENARGVSPRSLMYWERAATRPLHLPPDEDNENAMGISWLRGTSS